MTRGIVFSVSSLQINRVAPFPEEPSPDARDCDVPLGRGGLAPNKDCALFPRKINGLSYCLGALLLDRDHPWHVLARSVLPVMEPLADAL